METQNPVMQKPQRAISRNAALGILAAMASMGTTSYTSAAAPVYGGRRHGKHHGKQGGAFGAQRFGRRKE